jgi:hypothetical protein
MKGKGQWLSSRSMVAFYSSEVFPWPRSLDDEAWCWKSFAAADGGDAYSSAELAGEGTEGSRVKPLNAFAEFQTRYAITTADPAP